MTLPTVDLDDPRALRGYAHPLRMKLLGLLRVHGPMTATRAAAALRESVPSCSFHLRQLAKYGLVERIPGADARERPWRATAQVTHWDSGTDDPELQAAVTATELAVLGRYTERARAFLTDRHREAPEWRTAAGIGDTIVDVTAAELVELLARLDELLAEYHGRRTDPSTRPPGSRPVALIRMALPIQELPGGA